MTMNASQAFQKCCQDLGVNRTCLFICDDVSSVSNNNTCMVQYGKAYTSCYKDMQSVQDGSRGGDTVLPWIMGAVCLVCAIAVAVVLVVQHFRQKRKEEEERNQPVKFSLQATDPELEMDDR